MRTRILHTLGALALGVIALGLGMITIVSSGSTAATGQRATVPVESASTVGADAAATHPLEHDARFAELMTGWSITVPADVAIDDYGFIVGFDGQLRRATLVSGDATADTGKAWVNAVAAGWGVAPLQEEGTGFWAAWLPEVGGVRAPVGADSVSFVYVVNPVSPAFALPTGWNVPALPAGDFIDARVIRSATTDTYEFVAAGRPGDATEYLTQLAAAGWDIVDDRHAVRDGDRFEWHAGAEQTVLRFEQGVDDD